jgi:hypothetical protein
MKRYSLHRAFGNAINVILPLNTYCKLGYFIIIVIWIFIFYAAIKRTYYCHTIVESSSSETCHLPDYLKKLSTSSILEYFNDVNSIPGIPVAIRSILSTKYAGVNTSAASSYGAARYVWDMIFAFVSDKFALGILMFYYSWIFSEIFD